MTNTEPKRPAIDTSLRARHAMTRGMGIRGIVLHDTAGSGTHNDTRYLANPSDGRKVGVDYTIERDGSIWKLTPGDDDLGWCAPHAGRNTAFAGMANGRVNRVTIGIELVQHVRLSLVPLWPLPQIDAAGRLCAWLTHRHALDPSQVVTHRQIVTDGSRSDPRSFPFGGLNGFWHFYWKARGEEQTYLRSLDPAPVARPLDPARLPVLRLETRPDAPASEDVKALQRLLNERQDAKLVVDGQFGHGTLRAVRAFQVRAQLTPDGVVGRGTWTALLADKETPT